MKKLIEGIELQYAVPKTEVPAAGLAVKLDHGLTLTDQNFFQYPTALIGGVGTGKTTLTNDMLSAILRHADRSGDNVVIFAAKPDMLDFSRPGDIIIRVTGEDPKSCWNIFAEMAASGNPELTAREITNALFQEAREKTNQVFFPNAGAHCFHNVLLFMYHYGLEHGVTFRNGDLLEFLNTTRIHGDGTKPGWLDLARDYPEYFGMMHDYIGEGTEQGQGVLSELQTLLSRYFYGSFASYHGTFSAIEAIRSGGKRIFLFYEYDKATSSALVLFKIILDMLLKQSLGAENRYKTYFILDEYALLPKLDNISACLSYGRDPSGKKVGGCRILVALQSARLLTQHYSEAEALCQLSLFTNIISFSVMDGLSRKVLADRYGEARYLYGSPEPGGKIHFDCCKEYVVTDYHFSLLSKPGQAIMSLPFVSHQPFFYDGYRKELHQ